ncbi:cation diffusion facilitator family transporter [Salinisphaera sp.]|uniref:cation diffusion facilitator family transporter n=1 Tax=Salinisphaera sp. TaxID=1914330 RepID=UPI002D78FC7D|nr:cation diffusion facilitator family transporter [Salinisphaera sp.]HET7312778.1 cation diffusion facilitator family transporter [Salinisphaera sp.]
MSDNHNARNDATGDDSIPPWHRALLGGAISAIPGTREKHDGEINTVAVAFFANLVVALAKFGGYFVVHSSALLAEAIHSTAVTINQGLMLRGQLTARHLATTEHPFGFGRERYFWGFMVSVVMFGIGAVLSIGRGVLAIASGEEHEIALIWVPYAALTVGLVMDGTSLLQAIRQTRRSKGDLSYRQYIKRAKSPEAPLVLLEDSAAMFGLFFAYGGITLSLITGNNIYDGIASILVGLVLTAVSWILASRMKSLLIGESALPEEMDAIREALTGPEEVREVLYIRTLYLSPNDLLIETKVRFDPDMQFRDIATAIDRMEQDIRSRIGHARLISIEPDIPETSDVELPGYKSSEGES